MDAETHFNGTAIYYETLQAIERARLAYLFAIGQLTPNDARQLIYECQHIAGWYPLETMSVDEVVEDAGYRWSNSEAEIRPLAEEACARVSSKWDSSGDIPSAAQNWACNLIAEYAAQQGVMLVEGERDE